MFTTIAEYEADKQASKAERGLIAACRVGEEYKANGGALPDAGRSGAAITLRAGLIRLLALQASSLHENGVWLEGAVIAGTLNLSFATCRGSLVLHKCRLAETPRMAQVELAELSLDGSHFPGLFAQGAKVTGSVFLRGVTATGTVDVNAAQIGGQLACEGATLNGGGGMALNAQGAKVTGGVFLSGVTATGTVDVNAAQIGSALTCEGATLNGGGGKALNAQGAKVTGSMFLSGVTATGMVDVAGAQIGGQLSCNGATLNGGGGKALNAQGTKVAQDLLLSGVTATGTVDVNAAQIGGMLACEGATLNGGGGMALNAQSLRVEGVFFFRKVKEVIGRVDLVSAHVRDLADDAASWGKCGDVNLDGFTYDRIVGNAAPKTFAGRKDWLEMGSRFKDEFLPQPYTQFARVMRAAGHAGEARKALMARDRLLAIEARKIKRFADNLAWPLRWCWDTILRGVAGYGFAPLRSLVALVGLLGLAWFIAWNAWDEGSFAPNSDVILVSQGWQSLIAGDCLHAPGAEGCIKNPADEWSAANAPGMDWDSFNAFGYAADLVVPILDLGQTSAWGPSKDRGPWGWGLWWGRWVFAALGWIVTALGAAAVTGVIQRNSPE